jgi:hypothetical protein
MNQKPFALLLVLTLALGTLPAQSNYWQQHADYKISVHLDPKTNRFQGEESIQYLNSSPDTLFKAYFHLYLNAFQPGSDMDVRSRTITDPDARVSDRIAKLKPEETGEMVVADLLQDGKPAQSLVEGTILEVLLPTPIPPGGNCKFSMKFQGQVPQQIRRTGRDNTEGIRYSMAQWYPKLCEYDAYGWHANPYIGREFHGVWANFDVYITLNREYIVAATGTLQNPTAVGHGYSSGPASDNNTELTWNFKAERVHDFVWAADQGYKHEKLVTPSGLILHFFHQVDSNTTAWAKLPEYTAKAFAIMARDYGAYPYPSYSVIQGGDGGMEYPMATLITGHRNLGSLVGVTVHELIHSWFQGMLASNEALYPWMDEGFTTFATSEVMAELFPENQNPPHAKAYEGYFNLLQFGDPEPLSVHADHYQTNYCYGVNSYNKGEVLLAQLKQVIGESNFRQAMKRYFQTWKFKHPTSLDFMRSMEKVSGLELDWYFEYFVNTIHKVDYGVQSVKAKGKGNVEITLARVEMMPMPVDLKVTLKGGETKLFSIPLDLMRGCQPDFPAQGASILPDWHWVNKTYRFSLPVDVKEIELVEIDPEKGLADVERANNRMGADVIKQKPWEQYEK